VAIQLTSPSFAEKIPVCLQELEADDLDSDVEFSSSSKSENNIERLSEHVKSLMENLMKKRSQRKSHLVLFW
jgi:hypothetical protein